MAVLPSTALGLACALEDAELFLGALWLLAAEGARVLTEADLAAGAETAGASSDAIAESLEPTAATSAVSVETEPEEIAVIPTTGGSTTAVWVAVASGAGAASFWENVDWDGREMVSTDETPERKDCEALICLGLTAYRTTATPTPVPKSTVSICSKTILPVTPGMTGGHFVSFANVSKVLHNGINLRHAEIKILISSEQQLRPS
jgi:hypothetical protein